ncbi:hypothetical protein FRC12_022560 [Ceratobasidium sp. 428]|nr:hypothetical protein FRC12_022560 [Ceratobasidium sp. 428]
MLSIPGPGVPSTREQRGEMIRLLRNYLSISRQKILKYYYGFLCVRHLLHLLCLSILEEAGVLNGYLESLGLELGYNELTHAVARKVLKTVFQEKKGFGLEEVAWASSDHSSSSDDLPAETDLTLLISLLWDDRGSFLTLCANQSLPGCSTLLFTAFGSWRARPELDARYLWLQDLYCRVYLVGSNWDRQVLQKLIQPVLSRKPLEFCAADEQDKQAVSKAYSSLLRSSQRSPCSVPSLTPDVVVSLGDFVMTVVLIKPSMVLEEVIGVLRLTFEYYWVLLKCSGGVPVDERESFKLFVLHILTTTGTAYVKYVSKAGHGQEIFVDLLVNCDIISFVGQALILVFQSGIVASLPLNPSLWDG